MRKGLGKGLNAMIGDKEAVNKVLSEDYSGENIEEIDIKSIRVNPDQPRTRFSDDSIAELAASIKENGLIQPIILRKISDGYEIIAGERRFRAAVQLGMDKIPSIVRDIDEEKAAKISIIENIQRVDLNPIEEARAYERVINLYSLKQEELARVIGKSRAYVSNVLRLLKLDDRVIKMLEEGQLTLSHGKALLSLPREKQYTSAKKLLETKASVRSAERLKKSDSFMVDMENRLIESLGTKVSIVGNDKKGSIRINYFNNDDLERILEFLLRGEL